ncbi:Taf10p [Sporobolomyces salmoneus]|uniref:Taf10p n=1 Tax=Sporobolomyces salmoneus TaxID=183962 RepID=UPI00317FF91F
MNPQDLHLPQQPVASTSQLQRSTSTATSSQPTAFPGSSSAAMDPPKSKKETEQDQRDIELAQLLEQMDEYKPVIPDEVTDYYLQRSGFDTNDVRVKRLLALAAQKFIASISQDAFQHARARTGGNSTKNSATASNTTTAKGRQRTVLTMDDLSAALKEYGVDAGRAAYYL